MTFPWTIVLLQIKFINLNSVEYNSVGANIKWEIFRPNKQSISQKLAK